MKCDTNTMLKTAAGLAVVAGVVYFTVPAAQAFVLASATILIALICPISMLIMMKMMNSNGAEAHGAAGQSNTAPPPDAGTPDTAVKLVREANLGLQPNGASPLHQQGHAR